MTKQKKLWLGILTFLPILCVLVYIICFVIYFMKITSVTVMPEGAQEMLTPAPYLIMFGLMFAVIVIAAITSIGLLIYYIIHANSNPKFDSNQKLIWILILVFANGIGNIIYYFVEILPKDKTPILPSPSKQ